MILETLTDNRRLDVEIAKIKGLLVVSEDWPYSNSNEDDDYDPHEKFEPKRFPQYGGKVRGPVYLNWPHPAHPSFKDEDGTMGWYYPKDSINPNGRKYVAWPPTEKDSFGRIIVEDLSIVPFYSTDLRVAFPFLEEYQLCLIPLGEDGWFCGKFNLEGRAYFDTEFGIIDGKFDDGYAIGKTAPQTICLAVVNMKGNEYDR